MEAESDNPDGFHGGERNAFDPEGKWKKGIPFTYPWPDIFMDISVDGEYIGQIQFKLYWECDIACENFVFISTGEQAMGQCGTLHYKGNLFHRIIPGFLIQAGDITH